MSESSTSEARNNRLFALVVLALIGACVGAWYFLHPKSPYVQHVGYEVTFPEVGTLSPGDVVRVNGLARGSVQKVGLAGDSVLAHIAVRSDVELPTDSRIRIINVGLVGERVVDIQLGRGAAIAPPGARFSGGYDPGSTRLVVTAAEAFTELEGLGCDLDTVLQSTLLDTAVHQAIERVLRRLPQHVQKAQRMATEVTGEVTTTFGEVDRAGQTIQGWVAQSQPVRDQLPALRDSLRILSLRLDTLSVRGAALARQFSDSGTGSLSRIVNDQAFLELAGRTRKNAHDLGIVLFPPN